MYRPKLKSSSSVASDRCEIVGLIGLKEHDTFSVRSQLSVFLRLAGTTERHVRRSAAVWRTGGSDFSGDEK